MKTAQPDLCSPTVIEARLRTHRSQRISALALLASFLCLGTTSCTGKQIGFSIAGIATAVVVTTVVITREVGNEHHTLHGCLIAGPNGLELRTSDAKAYALEGELAAIKVGDRVKLHGSKLKKKGVATDQVFVVDKLDRNYGSCS